jgi:hypothetical protein
MGRGVKYPLHLPQSGSLIQDCELFLQNKSPSLQETGGQLELQVFAQGVAY